MVITRLKHVMTGAALLEMPDLSHGPETVENSEDLTRLPKSRLETRVPEPRLLSLWGQGSWTETKLPESRFLLFFTLGDFRTDAATWTMCTAPLKLSLGRVTLC